MDVSLLNARTFTDSALRLIMAEQSKTKNAVNHTRMTGHWYHSAHLSAPLPHLKDDQDVTFIDERHPNDKLRIRASVVMKKGLNDRLSWRARRMPFCVRFMLETPSTFSLVWLICIVTWGSIDGRPNGCGREGWLLHRRLQDGHYKNSILYRDVCTTDVGVSDDQGFPSSEAFFA